MTKSYNNLAPGIPKEPKREIDPTEAELASVGLVEPIKWGCEIPYIIDSSIVYPDLVKQAIDYIQHTTNYTFVPHTNQYNYIKFENGDGCYTSLGKGVTQADQIVIRSKTIHLSPYCNLSSIIHEITHVLGLAHEMSRLDRDNYIEILKDNIEDGGHGQFAKTPILSTGDFDYKSIMMYDTYAFSKNNKPTIKIKKELDHKLGGEYGYSIQDVKRINTKANLKGCPQKSKPPPCNDTDITFFDGEPDFPTYLIPNTHYYKVSDSLYESYDTVNAKKAILTLVESTKNIITNEIRQLENPYWEITYGGIVVARSESNDLFNTKWQIFNTATTQMELVDRAKMTKRDCSWPDLSAYKEKTKITLVNFFSSNLFIFLILLILFVIFVFADGDLFLAKKIGPYIPPIFKENKILIFLGNHFFKVTILPLLIAVGIELLIFYV